MGTAKAETEARSMTDKEQDRIVEEFKENILAFCEIVLSNGYRNGDIWHAANIDNDPISRDGKGSLQVVLAGAKAGCFYDWAEPDSKGGPVTLWKSVFGIADTGEAFAGMERWNRSGALPNGASADLGAYAGAAERERAWTEIEALAPSDAIEKEWCTWIETYRACTAHAEKLAETGWKEPWWGGVSYIGDKRASEIDWKAEAKRERAVNEEIIRTLKSLIIERRWTAVVEGTQSIKTEAARALADYRGLSTEIFEYLIERGDIGLLPVRDEIQIAFPVRREGWECQHVWRGEEASPMPRGLSWLEKPIRRTEYLGMHIRWFKGGDWGVKGGWRYDPKGLEISPYVVGDPSRAQVLLLAESSWDPVAFADIYELHKAAYPWAAVVTRSAANAARLPVKDFPPKSILLALLQNDAANAKWQRSLPFEITSRLREVRPPPEFKDLNDWRRARSAAEIRAKLENDGNA